MRCRRSSCRPTRKSTQSLLTAVSMAWRDGAGCVAGVATLAGTAPSRCSARAFAAICSCGAIPNPPSADPLALAVQGISGITGERLTRCGRARGAGRQRGRVLAANKLFADRAFPAGHAEESPRFSELVDVGEDGLFHLPAEGEAGVALRAVHIPVNPAQPAGTGTFLLFDGSETSSGSANLQALLEMLPIGLALVDRDGRFLTMNQAFRNAAGIKGNAKLVYPGDLVVKEDKAAVADCGSPQRAGAGHVRATLPSVSRRDPKEPVALTIAGLRGLGDAAVLLLLKDNSEEAKLKRQIAQATKMQAVGQLAGGVAHDFNNILTAIIGHCDLMLMRHTPGDSDYDDIQQIKSNSNRAAGLTRQLLAFSRQQTLRPQVLQLPDVVSEVSHLLKRLLGETVVLVVKHGRNLGSIRADPGQLEQVIINLAVNARDAMASKGGGTLTIQTYAVRSDQVAELGSEILPIADYTALSVSDTGCGIAPNVLAKVFEPFFTTKEVGKGTGLGLSTVYGIVKQSGGFIFADSKVDEGTRFVIYLPVHEVEPKVQAPRPAKGGDNELWGSGTVLLVEDEPMVRTVAERALTRHGYTVITANNGCGSARNPRPGRGGRAADQRRRHARNGRPDDGQGGPQEPARNCRSFSCPAMPRSSSANRSTSTKSRSCPSPSLCRSLPRRPERPLRRFNELALCWRVMALYRLGRMGQRSILVVEDEPLIAMMLEDFLESLGHSVSATCESVSDAIDRSREGRVRYRHPRRQPEGRERLAGR